MRFLIPFLLLLPTLAWAQGLRFEDGDWKTVLDKARKENRLVYVDVYATWCGPCKVLAANIFPQKEAGDVYNAQFVNYRIDAEKGEGIELAEKYAVTAFPTHLFIDPQTEAVVYRTTGAPRQAAGFNAFAQTALLEKSDPMTWELYAQAFKGGKRDSQFLKDYLFKAARLDQPNEPILDAYIATLDTQNLSDSTLYFLASHTNTIWSKALPLLEQNRKRLEKTDTNARFYGFQHKMDRIEYPSYKQALDAKDEAKLQALVAFIRTHNAEDPDESIFFYRKGFYEKTENAAQLKGVVQAEARRILQKKLSDYREGDAKARARMEKQVRYQLTGMTLPDTANVDSIVAYNVGRNVGTHLSVRAAATLNGFAWQVYENPKATAADLAQALQWSAKALELTAPHPVQWAGNADTHASLLYRTGKKADAIALEEKAVAALKKAGEEKEVASYAETLQKMKAGTY